MKDSLYPVIRPQIREGDIFAFSGHGFISDGIKLFTHNAISHIATVLRTDRDGRVYLIESTTLNGRKGVQINLASERVAEYEGSVFWLPLAEDFRARVDWTRFFEFLSPQEGKPYDYKQCLQMIWAPLAHVPGLGFLRNHEDLSRLYCSELVAAALEYAGGLPFGLDVSDTAPADLCSYRIYDRCVLLKGDSVQIRGFNSKPLAGKAAA